MRKISSALLVLVFCASPLLAALGQSEQSVQADRKRMSGTLRSATFEGYTVHEIDAGGGMVVREYVSPVGMVFGVVWEGTTMPDLSNLLGPYFTQFQENVAAHPHRRGPVYVQSGTLVVESGGHMRAFRGRAYVTDLIPANLTKDVVR